MFKVEPQTYLSRGDSYQVEIYHIFHFPFIFFTKVSKQFNFFIFNDNFPKFPATETRYKKVKVHGMEIMCITPLTKFDTSYISTVSFDRVPTKYRATNQAGIARMLPRVNIADQRIGNN